MLHPTRTKELGIYIYIYIYIYIHCHPQTDSFVILKLLSVASSWDRKTPLFTLDMASNRPANFSDICQFRNYNAYVLVFVCLHFVQSDTKDDMFGIIQIENIWEVIYNFPGVLDVWLLIYKYIKKSINIKSRATS